MLPQNNFNSTVMNKFYISISRKNRITPGLLTSSLRKNSIGRLLKENWEIETKGAGITKSMEKKLISIVEAGMTELNTSLVRDNIENEFKGSWIVFIHKSGCQLSYTCCDEMFVTLKNLNKNRKMLLAKTSK